MIPPPRPHSAIKTHFAKPMIWRFRPWPPSSELVPLMESLGVSPLVAAILVNRGFSGPGSLNPPLELLPLEGLEQAAARVIRAIEQGERIRVHGDYDADGLTGTAILLKGLGRLGANIHPFIPHRLDEGYGVLKERLPEHLEACDLFITVDCGITNHAELRELVENGLGVLVTDHHSPGPAHPPGLVVHPALSPRLEGLPHPTGSGVAFLLLWKVHELMGMDPPWEYADLAAIGTIADVAPLKGFNRALVTKGLEALKHSAHLGLSYLAQEHCRAYTATEVAFRIAPRINAASRLGQAELALELLTTGDASQAQALSQVLSQLNSRRQRIEEEMLERVLSQIDPKQSALVVEDPGGHPGVMGIVASRLVERFFKPAFIIAEGKGSVRSTPGISAVGALRRASGLLKRFGGHAQAAGFAIEQEKVPAFRQAILDYCSEHPVPVPEVLLDAFLERENLPELFKSLLLLEPLGEGNPEPVFYLSGKPEAVRTIGEGRHLSFRLGGLRVVKWKDSGESFPKGEIELAANLVLNQWNGEESVELRALAARPKDALLGARPGWAQPVPMQEALRDALSSGASIYVSEEGAEWFKSQGASVVGPETAAYWFSLPGCWAPREEVKVALSEKAMERLQKTNPAGLSEAGASTLLRLTLAKRLVLAYRSASAELFSEALECWWEYVQRTTSLVGEKHV